MMLVFFLTVICFNPRTYIRYDLDTVFGYQRPWYVSIHVPI